MTVRITLDARLYHYAPQAGIGQYIRRLAQALVRVAPEAEFTILQMRADTTPVVTGPNVHIRRLRTPCHHRWEQWALVIEGATRGSQVYHAPDFIPPFRRRCPAVITVHDLAFLRFPQFLTPEARRYYGQIHRAVVSAEAIIAVSESTRRDLLALTAAPANRIHVIPEAADPSYRPLDEAERARGPALPPGFAEEGYYLFVGTLEPRKNLPLLFRAFAAARRRGLRRRLLVVGKPGWLYKEALATLAALDLGEAVHLAGPATTEALRFLYGNAWALVLPSYYEGFGLTVLEAMACGTPVLVADCSSLPEVTGDGGRCLPLEEAAWTEALLALDADPAGRAELARRALAQAARFSWDRAARATLAVYQEVAA